jgi:hypothetical protein
VEFAAPSVQFEAHAYAISKSMDTIQAAFDLVKIYENTRNPLFFAGYFTPTPPEGGDSHQWEGTMKIVQQAVLDQLYQGTLHDINSSEKSSEVQSSTYKCACVFAGRKWRTSEDFPGAAVPPENDTVPHTLDIFDHYAKVLWPPRGFCTKPTIRPTGLVRQYKKNCKASDTLNNFCFVKSGSDRIRHGSSINGWEWFQNSGGGAYKRSPR